MNSPQLRFPAFKGEWTRNNFGDIVKINQGLQIPISERFLEQVEDSHFYITNEFLRDNSEKKYFIKNPPKSVICTKDDILMTRTGNTGMVVTNIEGAFHNNFFKIAYPQNVVKGFLYNFLKLPNTQKQIVRLAGTSTIPDLNHSDFYKIEFVFPNPNEQKQIADFVYYIDEKLQALKKKHRLLEQYKKGVMQKLFSQELRFKDENGNDFPEWEVKKLGEVLSIPEKIKPEKIEKNKLLTVKLHLKGLFKNGSTEGLSIGSTNYFVRKKGQFIYGKQNLFNGAFGIVSEEFDGFLTSGDVPALDIDYSKLNSMFLLSFLGREIFYKKLEEIASGSGSKRIHENIFLNVEIPIPCLAEQTAIANFLYALDEKINQTQTQIEKMEVWKKGLLQKMFM